MEEGVRGRKRPQQVAARRRGWSPNSRLRREGSRRTGARRGRPRESAAPDGDAEGIALDPAATAGSTARMAASSIPPCRSGQVERDKRPRHQVDHFTVPTKPGARRHRSRRFTREGAADLDVASARANSMTRSCICRLNELHARRRRVPQLRAIRRLWSRRMRSFSSTIDEHWLANEILLYWKRVLKRIDMTSRSLVALDRAGLVLCRLPCGDRCSPVDRSYMAEGVASRATTVRRRNAITLTDGQFRPVSRCRTT